MTSCKVGVFDVSEVVSVERHCLYLPEGSPEVTGEVPPTEVHEGLASPLANEVSLALTSKVIFVLVGNVLSQDRASHLAPATPASRTSEAIVPEEVYMYSSKPKPRFGSGEAYFRTLMLSTKT